MSAKWKLRCAIASLAGIHSGAMALDGTTIELLTGNQSEIIRLGLQAPSTIEFTSLTQSNVSLAWQYSFAYWRESQPNNDPSRTESLFDLGFTPLLRWKSQNSLGWYGEAGIGAHLLSKHYNNNGREFSTRLQFASHLGIGYAFQDRWTLAFKVEHVSNGSIKRPNPGVNFIGLQVGKGF